MIQVNWLSISNNRLLKFTQFFVLFHAKMFLAQTALALKVPSQMTSQKHLHVWPTWKKEVVSLIDKRLSLLWSFKCIFLVSNFFPKIFVGDNLDSDNVVWIKVELNPDSNIVVRLMVDYEYSKWFLQYLTLAYKKRIITHFDLTFPLKTK